jgi:hypothetical protein
MYVYSCKHTHAHKTHPLHTRTVNMPTTLTFLSHPHPPGDGGARQIGATDMVRAW